LLPIGNHDGKLSGIPIFRLLDTITRGDEGCFGGLAFPNTALAARPVEQFLLEAGIHAAEEALANRRSFRMDDAQWQAFQDVLDRPVRSKPRLAKLLAEKSVLE
jgi:hypothetical protein